MTPEPSTTQRDGRASPGYRWLAWAGVAAVAAPVTIVAHELGHFAAAKAFGFPDVSLHYGSVSDGADAAGFPRWRHGLEAAAGPVVTILIVLACCVAARRRGPRPLAVASGFAAGVRSVLIGGTYLVLILTQGRPTGRGGFDELKAARGLGLSPDLVVGAGSLSVLAGWAYLAHLLPASRRRGTLGRIALGTAAGVASWSFVGFLLLP